MLFGERQRWIVAGVFHFLFLPCLLLYRTWCLSTTSELCWADSLHGVLTLTRTCASPPLTVFTPCCIYSYAMKVLFMVLNEKAALNCDDVSLPLYTFKIEPWLYIKHIDILSAFRLRWLFLYLYSFIFILCRFLFRLQGWCCGKSLAPKRKPQKPWPLSSIQDLLRPYQGRHISYESAKRLMLFWNVETFLRCFCAEVS